MTICEELGMRMSRKNHCYIDAFDNQSNVKASEALDISLFNLYLKS